MIWIAIISCVIFTVTFLHVRKRIQDDKLIEAEKQLQDHLKLYVPKQPKRTPIRTHSKENCKNCGANVFYDWTCSFCGTKQKEEKQITNYNHSSGISYSSGVAHLANQIERKIFT